MKINFSILILLFFIGISSLFAQVGINNLDPNASLDVSASNQANPSNTDGVIIPRVDAFPVTNPGVNQHSMLVYLTTTSGTNVSGFYYWNNTTTSWIPLENTSGNNWTLTGNAGTTNGVEFIGTTDNQALDIRTNNQIKARVTTTGQIEILNTGNSVFIGENSGTNDDLTNNNNTFIGSNSGASSTTGGFNVAVGENAMNANTTGFSNTVIGAEALQANTLGRENTTFGYRALVNATSGNENTIIGSNSAPNATSAERSTIIGRVAMLGSQTTIDNVAIGNETLSIAQNPTNNTVVGNFSDFQNSGNPDSNLILGYRAGRQVSDGSYNGRVILGANAGNQSKQDNVLIIENSNSNTPLLLGEFDNDILRVGGQLQIGSSDDTTEGVIYSFPVVDGTNGQALTTDGLGNVSWSSISGGADTQDLSIDNTVGDLSLVDGGIVELKTIADSDDDTLIQVEETTDEDIIRFDVAGNEHFTMNNKGQLQVYNSGQSVLIGEEAGAAHDNTATRRNTLIGYQAGKNITTGPNNTVIGWKALDAATDGVNNTIIIGQSSAGSLTTGTSNVSLGVASLGSTTTSNNTVAIGANALSNSIGGDNNVAIGRSAGSNIDADDNVFIGAEADTFNHGVNGRNVVIGTRAGESGVSGTAGGTNYQGRVLIGYEAGGDAKNNNTLYVENSASPTPLLYGEFDNDVLRVNGQLQIGFNDDATAGTIYSFPTVDGSTGQALTTDGTGNVSWSTVGGSGADTQDLSIDNTVGDLSLVDGGTVELKTIADSDDDTLIQVEESADEDIVRFDIKGQELFTFDSAGRIQLPGSQARSVFIGQNAGINDDLTDNFNVFIGQDAGEANTTGFSNIAIGRRSQEANSIGFVNTSVGSYTLSNMTEGYRNVVMGHSAMSNLTTGERNTAIGTQALWRVLSDDENTAIGYGALGFGTVYSETTAVGALAGYQSFGTQNVFLGNKAEYYNRDADRNVVIGYEAGIPNIPDVSTPPIANNLDNRVIIGYQAGSTNTQSNALIIESSNSNTPLIGGDFSNNKVGINKDISNLNNLTHTLNVGGSVKIDTLLNLKPSLEPTAPEEGDVYYDSGLKKVRVYTGIAWENLN